MKSFIPFLVFILLGLMVYGQEGVNFESLTFNEALEKAKIENKLVFMDCYTSWCGPCKMMTNKVFLQQEAGEYFNPRFISVKFDMEKGEGIELAKKFNVKSFPTFLIICPDGTVQHKVVGGGGLKSFISWVEMGMNKKTSLVYLDELYEKGKMNKKELLTYHTVLSLAGERGKDEKVSKELKEKLTDKDKLKADYWFIVKEQPYGSVDFKLVVAHYPVFRENVGEKGVDFYLKKCYNQVIHDYLMGREKRSDAEAKTLLEEIRQELSTTNWGPDVMLANKLRLVEACVGRDSKQIIPVMEQTIGKKIQDFDLWVVLSALSFMRKGDLTEVESNQLITIENQLVKSRAEGEGRDKIKRYFSEFRK